MTKELGNAQLQITIDGVEAIVDINTIHADRGPINVCWISAENLENFVNELNAVISKYRI